MTTPLGRRQGAVLFFSNGHGEDAVGATIASACRALAPHRPILAAPIVGEGLSYRRHGFDIVVPTRAMPSGGLIGLADPRGLLADLRQGLVSLHVAQLRRLRAVAREVALVVGVGDRVSLLVARWLRLPLVWVAIADSVLLTGRIEGVWTALDRLLMRRHTLRIFTRDEPSARALAADGAPAAFVGNPMLDALETTTQPWPPGLDGARPLIALLPGSRETAYRNVALLLQAAHLLSARLGVAHVVAWPQRLSLAHLGETLEVTDWTLAPADAARGMAGLLRHPSGLEVPVMVGRTGDVIIRSSLVMGMAGTAHEQAAGDGKPLVVCPAVGPPVTRELVRRQGRLLGDAVRAVERDPQALAQAAWDILNDPTLYRRMSEAGRSAMGPPGGARRIAVEVLRLLEEKEPDRPGW